MPCAANTGFPPMRFYSNGLRCIIKAIESSRHAERGRKQIWPRKKIIAGAKLQAVLYCLEHQLDYRQTSEQYKITYQQIYSWVKNIKRREKPGCLTAGENAALLPNTARRKSRGKAAAAGGGKQKASNGERFLKKLNELEGRR